MHWDKFPYPLAEMEVIADATVKVLPRVLGKDGLIVYRGCPGNIKNCPAYEWPFDSYDYHRRHPELFADFNWEQLEPFNKIWQDAIKDRENFLYYNVRPLTLLPMGRISGKNMLTEGEGNHKTDIGHEDCAHECIPGPWDP